MDVSLAKASGIGPRTGVERYRVRSVAGGYAGDVIESHSRRIGAKVFDFVRITWADGSVTLRMFEGGTTILLREVTSCGGVWTDPAYLDA